MRTIPGRASRKLENAEMTTRTVMQLRLPILGGSVAALLAGGIVIASLAISAQGSNGVIVPAALRDAAAATSSLTPGAGAVRCPECGVIASMRKIESPHELIAMHAPGRIAAGSRGETDPTPGGTYEITIRLQDGSMHVITDAHPARWRLGEWVHLIGGKE
jgi:hypothetical protein